jgi:hypothetical protein
MWQEIQEGGIRRIGIKRFERVNNSEILDKPANCGQSPV